MKRRSFFKAGLTAGAAVGSYVLMGKPARMFGAPTEAAPIDLVAVRGGEPDVMFDHGMEALGGIRSFVKKGQKVVVKPNIGWDVPPERAANTHPRLVMHIIRQCYEAGAKEVYVFDHTCDNWQRCYDTSGIEKAVRDAGGKMAPGHSESYYHPVTIPGGLALTSAKEHELILESDVFINVPVVKTHSSSRATVAMKNLMGIIWDRRTWHASDLHQCIADFAAYRKPTLNVVDGYAIMKRNGPRGVSKEDVVTAKTLLISSDMVAVDTAAVKLLGLEPDGVRYIQLAVDKKVGRKDLENLNIKRIAL